MRIAQDAIIGPAQRWISYRGGGFAGGSGYAAAVSVDAVLGGVGEKRGLG